MIELSRMIGLQNGELIVQAIVVIKKNGVKLINIDDGHAEELQLNWSYKIESVTHKDREYCILRGTRLGSTMGYWLGLEKDGAISLERIDGPTIDGVRLPITSRAQLTKHQIEHLRIGVLVKGRFLCDKCALKENLVMPDAIAVYPINILPYSQACWECDQMIVQIAKDKKGGPLMVFQKPVPVIKTAWRPR